MRKAASSDLFSTERMVTYSDGIMAFAATLLLLGIRIPRPSELGGKSLLQAMAEQWPSYVSFVISFVLVTLIWANHELMFRHIPKGNRTLLIINSFLLMDIVLLPVATGLWGEYAHLAPEDAKTSGAIYGGLLALGGIPFNLIWWYAARTPGLAGSEKNKRELRRIGRHFIRGPFFYLVATLLTLWNIWVGTAFYIFLILFFLLPESLFLPKRNAAR